MNQVELALARWIPGVLMSTDVGLHPSLLQQGLDRFGLLEPFSRSIPPLADAEEWQMTHHHAHSSLLSDAAVQLPAGPVELFGRDPA